MLEPLLPTVPSLRALTTLTTIPLQAAAACTHPPTAGLDCAAGSGKPVPADSQLQTGRSPRPSINILVGILAFIWEGHCCGLRCTACDWLCAVGPPCMMEIAVLDQAVENKPFFRKGSTTAALEMRQQCPPGEREAWDTQPIKANVSATVLAKALSFHPWPTA